MQRPSPSRRHLCGASGEPKAKPDALLFATTLPSDRPGNLERFSPPLAKYRSAQKRNVGQSKKLQRGRQLDPSRRSIESQEFDAALRRKIVGQEEGMRALVDLYQVFCAGMCPQGRPVGNMLFLGPTGSGKTRIVEAAAEILFGDPRAVIKVDCAEFQHSHEIAKLIGSPPEAARRKFSPEFMNRLDKVVVFHPLRPEQLEQILEIELGMVSLNRRALYNPFTLKHLARTRHSFRGPCWNPNCACAALAVVKEVWND